MTGEQLVQMDTLTLFGNTFQSKVISTLLTNIGFVEQSIDIVKPEYFDNPARQWLVNEIIEYYGMYRCLPTLEVFKVEVNKIEDSVLKVSVIEQLKTAYKHMTDEDLVYVQDKFLMFCKNQTLKKAILDSVDLLKNGEFDSIKKKVDDAMRAGVGRDFGHDWKLDVVKRLERSPRNTIPTPWKVINNVMDGGLAGGELGVIAAPAGIGKSWCLTAIGAHAMKLGYKVAHFTLELNDGYQGTRYDSVFTGIEPRELKNYIDVVKETVAKVPGELKIKYFPARVASPNSLFSHIQQMKIIGYSPDIFIIDYADLLKASGRSDNRYQELGLVYEELRGLGGEMNIPCWTASQTQRSSINDDVIQADKIAESYGKIMTADFVMSLSRKLDDKIHNTARLHVMKNRFGPDGLTFPAHVDIVRGLIDVYEEDSAEGRDLINSMQQSPDIVKDKLRQRLALFSH